MASFASSIISFVVLALFYSISVEGAPVPAIFVFGDSLADVGNNNYLDLLTRYKANFPHNGIDFPSEVATGRFSNGFNAIDFIAMTLGFEKSPPPYLSVKNARQMQRGVSFASAGSGILQTTGKGTLNMETQVNYFARTKQALEKEFGGKKVDDSLKKSLFYFTTANNDFFALYNTTGATNSTENSQYILNLVDEFIGHLTVLYKLGARKFAIAGPFLDGCLPIIRTLHPTGDCVEVLNQMSIQFSAVAMPRIQQLCYQLAGFNYSYFNHINAMDMIFSSANAYGFKVLKSACCGGGKFNGEAQCTPNATYCSNRNEYFFWDWFHPTQALYNLLAHFQLYGSASVATPINLKQLAEL